MIQKSISSTKEKSEFKINYGCNVLGIGKDAEITISADGKDEQVALNSLQETLNNEN